MRISVKVEFDKMSIADLKYMASEATYYLELKEREKNRLLSSGGLVDHIKKIIVDHGKIAAIHALRDLDQGGILECKRYVDAIVTEHLYGEAKP